METQPEVRLVVAAQEYDPAVGTPQVQIPAFAAVFRLRHPADVGPNDRRGLAEGASGWSTSPAARRPSRG